jgi:hypothetical protein
MTTQDMTRAVSTEAAKAFPPLTVMALTLNEWVAVATVAYIFLQALYLLRKWFREEQAKAAKSS